jgi:hypothetical protein
MPDRYGSPMTALISLPIDRFQHFAEEAAAHQGLLYARERAEGSLGLAGEMGRLMLDALRASEQARADGQRMNTVVVEQMFSCFMAALNEECRALKIKEVPPSEIIERLRKTTESDEITKVQAIVRGLLRP